MRLKIRNWRRYQHYTNRNPPWIKLHGDLLTSRDWVSASDSERVLAIACMLIAAKTGDDDGTFDADPEYLQRAAYLNTLPDLKPLINRGFLEVVQADASKTLADASKTLADARIEGETEGEEETEQNPPHNPPHADSDASPTRQSDNPPKKTNPAKKKKSQTKPDEQIRNLELPDGLSLMAWCDWAEYRREKRKKLTISTAQRQLTTLAKLRDNGHPPDAVIEQSITQGWIGLFPLLPEPQDRNANGAAPDDPLEPSQYTNPALRAAARRAQAARGDA